MVANVVGRVRGSKKFSFSWSDLAQIGMELVFVMVAAGCSWGVAELAAIKTDNLPSAFTVLIPTFMAALRFAAKWFSDTRNVPVVGSMRAVGPGTEPEIDSPGSGERM